MVDDGGEIFVRSCCCLVAQLCLTVCDPMNCGPPGSSVHGILQARILELPFPPPGDLPSPGTEPTFRVLPVNSLPLSTREALL